MVNLWLKFYLSFNKFSCSDAKIIRLLHNIYGNAQWVLWGFILHLKAVVKKELNLILMLIG